MRFTKNFFGIVTGLLLFSSLTFVPVGAQESSANAAQGMQISPTLVELNAEKGKSYNIKLTVTNVTASDLVYSSSVDDFNAADETGSPHIIVDSELPETASIKTWINTELGFTLTAHESKTVTAQIVVPENAEPGGHYGVLRFSGRAPELEGTGVGLSASAGVLILVRVGLDSEIIASASLASFFSANGDNQSSFFENSPIDLVARIENDGNVHVKPSGDIEVRDMFGGLTATFPVNKTEPRSNVLPDSIRKFSVKLDKPWMIGLYTANLTLGYGTTGQAITSTITFWVIPYKIILAGIFILVTIVYILKRLIRVYNRRIIEKAKNEGSIKNKNHTT